MERPRPNPEQASEITGMSRRDFLKLAGVGAFLAAVGELPVVDAQAEDPNISDNAQGQNPLLNRIQAWFERKDSIKKGPQKPPELKKGPRYGRDMMGDYYPPMIWITPHTGSSTLRKQMPFR